MASKAERGTKRTCQNGSCSARFYDLSRNPIVCPICSSAYVIAQSAPSGAGASEAARRSAKKPDFPVVPVVAADADADAEDVLVEVEEAADEVAAGGEETFLEQEEDEGGDVSGIIGGPASEGDEEV